MVSTWRWTCEERYAVVVDAHYVRHLREIDTRADGRDWLIAYRGKRTTTGPYEERARGCLFTKLELWERIR